jgi:hypothetical protein
MNKGSCRGWAVSFSEKLGFFRGYFAPSMRGDTALPCPYQFAKMTRVSDIIRDDVDAISRHD